MSLRSANRDNSGIVILLLSGLGMLSVWLRQLNYGVGLSPDPVHLISIADNLTRGEGLVAWDGRGFNPVFPFTLALVLFLGDIDGSSASAYINIVAFGLSIWISIVWLSDKIKSRIIVLFAGIAFAFSPLLGNVHANAMTEPMFILFVVTSLFALDRFLDSNKERWIILAALSAAMSILTRHMGVSLIVSTLMLLAIRGRLSLQRIRHTVIYLVITVPIVGVYVLRNFLRYRRLTERQWATGFSHSDSIESLISELISWTLTDIGFDYLETAFDISSNTSIRISVLIIIMIAFTGYGLVYFQRSKRPSEIGGLATPIVFIVIYSFILYFSLRISDIGSIHPRYLSPIYIPVIVIIVVVLKKVLSRIAFKYTLPFIGLLGLWLILLAVANYDAIKQWQDYGYNRNYYSAKDWVDSETINYLKSNPVVGQIHSNNIRAVYAHMRIPDDAETFFDVLPSYLPEDSLHWDWSRANNIDMYIIWFYGWKAYEGVPLHYDFMSLATSQNIQVVEVFEDGIILTNSQGSPLSLGVLKAAILKDAELIVANPMVDLYLDGKRLIYILTSCISTDIKGSFFLHIHPVHRDDISEGRNDLDFNNYDFSLHREGFFFGEGCAVIRNLPEYDIKIIRTGQHIPKGDSLEEVWAESFTPQTS